ncbi:MAG: hypothetical protein IJQ63_12295 [Synergistaceae bacterium]|nr:hypothetical protein [Synergistaceae bacterium]MBR0222538.1 hypothetical protein [Synergistaceae bacterium]
MTSVNLSNNPGIGVLTLDYHKLTQINVSNLSGLHHFHCIGNELTALDVTQNPALTALYCDNNHITELDLSRNKALTEVHCYGQTAKGLIVKATDKGYEVDIKDYVKNLENLDVYSFQANHRNEPFVSYEDGVVTFSELPENVTYFYRTHSPNNALMDVTIERSLII